MTATREDESPWRDAGELADGSDLLVGTDGVRPTEVSAAGISASSGDGRTTSGSHRTHSRYIRICTEEVL